MNDPTGAVRICRRNPITCWIYSDREQYDWTVAQAIEQHPKEKIYAGWTYQDISGCREDRTRYNPDMGRVDFEREWPMIHGRRQL